MRAFVFPGQGSQGVGMGRELAQNYLEARRVFDEADAVLGSELSRLCFEGPEEQLRRTEFTQPAILTVSVAAYRVLQARGKEPDVVAGHSLGEYSALVCSGALAFDDTLRLVRARGRFMQEAVPVGEGSMAAIVGLSEQELEGICRSESDGQVVAPANVNAPFQVVISGHLEAVRRACEAARRCGAKVFPLPVSAPFHCELMNPARERLRPLIERLKIGESRWPLVNNVEARMVREPEEIRQGLIRQVSATVRWSQSVRTMLEVGATVFVEVGPGRVLTNLIRKMAPDVEALAVGSRQQVEAYE